MTGWIVTGTDTGVGKTVVAAVLAALHGATYVKPVQSGADDGDDDAGLVARLAGVPTRTGSVLGPSLAPAVAARRAGTLLTRDDLLAPVEAAPPDRPVVVEGAGGLLVELATDGTTIANLAAETGLPIVVAAKPGLGTLNHTCLTLEAADHRGIAVAGVVISGWPDHPDLATRTNVAEILRLSGGRLAGLLPRLELDAPLADPTELAAWLTPALGGTADPATWAVDLDT